MKVKVSELKGRALNFAIAVCEYGEPVISNDLGWVWNDCSCIYRNANHEFRHLDFNPSGNWAHAGSMIRKYRITLSNEPSGDGYMASINAVFEDHPDIDVTMHGSTQLEAICLCLVKYRNRLNDEIEIPDELVEE